MRLLAFYFVGLAVWQAWDVAGAGTPAVVGAIAWGGALGAAVLGLAALYAWWAARSTVYTITTRRIVLTFGIALPVSLSLPFKSIASAGLKLRSDGTGDIPLNPGERRRLSYLVLWPHARPWRLGRVQPMLRSVPDAAGVAEILSAALVEAHAARPVPVLAEPVSAPSAQARPDDLRHAAA
jgi:hypothetical protein